jgi:hypothetical protein
MRWTLKTQDLNSCISIRPFLICLYNAFKYKLLSNSLQQQKMLTIKGCPSFLRGPIIPLKHNESREHSSLTCSLPGWAGCRPAWRGSGVSGPPAPPTGWTGTGTRTRSPGCGAPDRNHPAQLKNNKKILNKRRTVVTGYAKGCKKMTSILLRTKNTAPTIYSYEC